MDDGLDGIVNFVRTNSFASSASDGNGHTVPSDSMTEDGRGTGKQIDKVRTRRCVTAYDDLVPVAWRDVPEGEPDPVPLYLSTSAARLYMGLDEGHEVTVRGEEPVITPADVDVMRRGVLRNRYRSIAMIFASVINIIVGAVGSLPIICVLGAFMMLLALLSLIDSLTDTSHLLMTTAYAQQERLLARPQDSSEDSSLPDASSEAPADADADSSVSQGEQDEDLPDGETELYEDRMGRRAEGIRQQLSTFVRMWGSEITASASVIGDVEWQTERAERAYKVAMVAIEHQFEPNSISWQRFAYGAKAGYEKILANSEAVIRCMESLDMTEYDGGRIYWGDDGKKLEVPIPAPSSRYKKPHESLLRLVNANQELLNTLTRLSCDLASMMADEATDGTGDVTNYLQGLVNDLPEYRNET